MISSKNAGVGCLVVLALTMAMLGGCASGTFFNNQRQISRVLLHDPNAAWSEDAVAAALRQRFPPGSPVGDVQAFIGTLGVLCGAPGASKDFCVANPVMGAAGCISRRTDTLSCDIPVASSFCVNSYLMITIKREPADTVQSIYVKSGVDAC